MAEYGVEGIWILLMEWTNFALSKGIDALIWGMTTLQRWLLKKKKEVFEAVAAWLDTGYRGLKLLLIVYAAGFAVVGIEAISLLVKKRANLKAALAALQTLDTLARVKLSVDALKIAWQILTEIDERFAELEKSFFQFCQAFDETFGWPLGFLASFASSYRAYLKSLYTMLGFQDADARVAWFTNISDALSTADKAFNDYALNPGKFLTLVEGLAVIASGDEAARIERDNLQAVAGLLEDTEKLARDLGEVWSAMESIRATFPDEVKEVLDRQWAPIKKVYDDTIQDILDRIEESAGEMLGTVRDLIAAAAEPLAVQLDEIAPWVRAFYRFLGYEIPDPEVKALYLDQLFTEGILKDNATLLIDSAVFDIVHDMNRPKPEEVEGERYEPSPVFVVPALPAITTKDDPAWYAGESRASGSKPAPWYVGG